MAKGFSDLPEQYQLGILIAVPVVLAAVVFYVLVSPLSAQKTTLQEQVETLRQQNQANLILEKRRAAFLKQIAEAQVHLKQLQAIVPDEPATDQFIRMVHDTAAAAHVHLRDFTAQNTVPRNYYTDEPFKLRLDGTYYDMLDFFGRLATAPRIVNVSSLSMGAPGGGGSSYKVLPGETLGVDCIITTFYSSGPLAPPPAKKRK
ncbi:MAG TPA: type 4a pilus biogenesis protein PilO [Terriglobia bacterium]|nr:type 4a pilus biogenesis protein PilO [Terriglobia bacterium]